MTRTRNRVLILVGVLVTVVAGNLALNPIAQRWLRDPAGAQAETGVTEVSIADSWFDPPAIEVPAGTEVTWTFVDDNEHNVVFEDGPASPISDSGTWSRTFAEPGTYAYSCTLHAYMDGRVDVTS